MKWYWWVLIVIGVIALIYVVMRASGLSGKDFVWWNYNTGPLGRTSGGGQVNCPAGYHWCDGSTTPSCTQGACVQDRTFNELSFAERVRFTPVPRYSPSPGQ